MKVEIIKCLKDNYSYVIIDEKNNHACVVDPSEAEPIINFSMSFGEYSIISIIPLLDNPFLFNRDSS